jgi:hypothetical protein
MSLAHVILIVVIAIVFGLAVGYLLSYLVVTRILKKPFRENTAELHLTETEPGLPPTSTEQQIPAPQPDHAVIGPVKPAEVPPAVRIVPPPVPTPAPRTSAEPATSVASGLFAEIEADYKTATQPWAGKLTSFQTQVWDSNSDGAHSLSPSIREGLTQAYADMRLANSIVWLSTELGRRSASLDESYVKLCATIADRLGRAMPLLKQSSR